jgi:pyruvate-formate lyase-activating enzyme
MVIDKYSTIIMMTKLKILLIITTLLLAVGCKKKCLNCKNYRSNGTVTFVGSIEYCGSRKEREEMRKSFEQKNSPNDYTVCE